MHVPKTMWVECLQLVLQLPDDWMLACGFKLNFLEAV